MLVAIDTDSEILQRLSASRQLFPHPHDQHAIASTTRLTFRLSTFSSLRMQAPTNEVRDAAIIDGAKDIAFGSVSVVQLVQFERLSIFQVAGMVSKVFEHPFDLCKVRLQSQVLDDIARFNGPIDCLTKTWRNEGVRGLYRVSMLAKLDELAI